MNIFTVVSTRFYIRHRPQ